MESGPFPKGSYQFDCTSFSRFQGYGDLTPSGAGARSPKGHQSLVAYRGPDDKATDRIGKHTVQSTGKGWLTVPHVFCGPFRVDCTN